MASNDYLITLLPYIIQILSRYFLPFVIVIGNISCILSLLIFLQKSMRKNSSGLYFLSLTLSNIIFINITIIATVLFFGFNIDSTGKILTLCQLQFYIGFVVSLLSSAFLVLASIDRFMITSSNFNINQFSTRSIALKLIFIITIFSCILHTHAFFNIVDVNGTKGVSCTFRSGAYILVLSWYIFLIFGFLTPALMIIFGIRTIINVRRVMIVPMNRLYSIDRQLILIMLSQCFVNVIFHLPLAVYFIYAYTTKNSMNDIHYYTINLFFFYIALICFYIPYCSFFYVNLISYSFRMEFKRLIKNLFKKNIPQQLRKIKKQRNQQIFPLAIIQQRPN